MHLDEFEEYFETMENSVARNSKVGGWCIMAGFAHDE